MKKLNIFTAIILWLGIGSFFRQLSPEQAQALVVENDQVAEQILRSTVRLHLRAWRMMEDESGYFLDESIGHATLREDNVLVTHNHYSLLNEEDLILSVAFFAAAGRPLFSVPLKDFTIRQAGPETLHFALNYDYLALRFAQGDIVPAKFATWHELELQPGAAVAQVDWDGRRTRVDWVYIEQIIEVDGVPGLVIEDGLMVGASGGGLFVNGRHIANNWQSIEHLDGSDRIIYESSIGALN